MRMNFDALPPDLQERLGRVWEGRGLGEGSLFLEKPRRWMVWTGVISLLACGIATPIAFAIPQDPSFRMKSLVVVPVLIAAMTGVYGPLVLWEWFRQRWVRPGRFTLITPLNYVECRGPGRMAVLYRLNQVTQFKKTQEYDQNQKWSGLAYAFTFEDGPTHTLTLKQQADMDRLDAILAWAAAKGRGEALPDLPGTRHADFAPPGPPPRPLGPLDQLRDPQSELWLGMAGVLVLVLLAAFILNGIFGSR